MSNSVTLEPVTLEPVTLEPVTLEPVTLERVQPSTALTALALRGGALVSSLALLACSGQNEVLFGASPGTGQQLAMDQRPVNPAPALSGAPPPLSNPAVTPPPAVAAAPLPGGSSASPEPAEPPLPAEEPPAPPPPVPAPCTSFGAFDVPEPITGLDLPGQALGPVFSADGLTLFFSALPPEEPPEEPPSEPSEEAASEEGEDENIFSAQRKLGGSQFTPATLVPNLDAGGSQEGTPFLSFDGLSLYFFSTRPGPGVQGGRDIWLTTRPAPDAAFAEPAVLPGVNSPELEHLPRLSRDELSIFFVSSRESPNEATNLWVAQRQTRTVDFAAPVEVAGINSNAREEGFTLSADGLTLFFSSNRLLEEQMDLFVATRPDSAASFATPEPLAQLNSDSDELDPQLSPDGLELFFASSREGRFQLFRASRECDTP